MTTYYMRGDGSAANKAAATSDAAASTSMDISVYNGETFSAGDEIVLSDAGGVYRATIVPPSAGSSGNLTTHPASGSPVISGADLVSTWTAKQSDVHLDLPGSINNIADSVGAASLDVSTDLDVICYLAADDWTPGGDLRWFARWGGGDVWNCAIRSSGLLLVQTKEGAANKSWISSAATGFANGTGHWLRITVDIDNGSGDADATFYTSDDPSDTALGSISWSQLGNVIGLGSTTTINTDAGSVITVGGKVNGADPLAGKYYRAVLRDGIGGTILWDANFQNETAGTTSFTEDGANGHTVVVRQSGDPQAEIVGSAYTNIWEATLTNDPHVVWIDNNRGIERTGFAGMTQEYDWYFNSGTLYVYSATDPDAAYSSPGVEAAVRINAATIDKEYLSFTGITFRYHRHPSGSNGCVEMGASGSHAGCTFTDCTFDRGGSSGVLTKNGAVTFTDCIFQYNRGVGAAIKSAGCTLTGGSALYNGVGTKSDNGSGIFIEAANVTIEDMLVHNNGDANDHYNDPSHHHGVYLTEGGTGATITNVTSYDNDQGHGLSLRDSCTVVGCLAYGNWGGGFGVHNWQPAGGITIDLNYCIAYDNNYGLTIRFPGIGAGILALNLYNVVFYGNSSAELEFNDTDDAEDTVYNGDYNIRNSILHHTGSNDAIVVDDDVNGDGTLSDLDSDYNCIYAPSGNIARYGVGDRNWSYWTTTLGQDGNGINEDPLLTDAAGDDFTLQDTSPCINAGTDVSLTQDFAGTAVPIGSDPDIGAYESEAGVVAKSIGTLDVLTIIDVVT